MVHKIFDCSFIQLLNYGVHIGHSLFNTLFFSSWMLLGFRQNIWIIDITKTIYFLKLTFNVFKFIVSCKKPIWFLNLESHMDKFLAYSAKKCGEFFLTSNWIRGLLTNFKYISVSHYMKRYYKAYYRNTFYNKFFLDWIFTRILDQEVYFVLMLLYHYQ